MSVMAAEIEQIALNEQQINAIIEYAKQGGMYDGPIPEDPDLRRRDAATLVYQARRARANGNNSAQVQEVCFIADVDQAPQPQNAQPSVTHEVSAADPPIAEQVEQTSQTNGAGTAEAPGYTEEQLVQMIEALRPNAGVPAIKAEVDKLEAQLQQRRADAGTQAQVQVPPPAPQGAPPAAPGPVGAEPSAPPMPPAPGPSPVPEQPGPVLPGVPADAAAPPAVQAPQPGAEGVLPQAEPDAEAGRRAALEAQVTGQMLVSYGKSFADVPSIPTDDLERMVAAPGGPVAQPAPPVPQPQVSEREGLIEQVTGPMLKAWRRGRVDLVKMSDDEIRAMVESPGGPPQAPQPPQADVGAAPTSPPTQTTAAQQPEQPGPTPQPDQASSPAPAAAPVTPGPTLPTPTSVDDLIASEKFPLPPEIEDPPLLPGDLSRSSDDELRSVHGRFHAVLARVNWVIAQHKDEVFGMKRALAAREVEARNSLPKSADGKRVTKDEAAAMVAADAEVVRLEAVIAEKERPLIKLEAISENARSTCARCSREWSFRKGEEHPIMRGER